MKRNSQRPRRTTPIALAATVALLLLTAVGAQGAEEVAPLVTAQKVVPQPICTGHRFELQGIFTGLRGTAASVRLLEDVRIAPKQYHSWDSAAIHVEPKVLSMTFPSGLGLSTSKTYRIDLYDGAKRRSTLRGVKIAACTKEGMPLATDPTKLNLNTTPKKIDTTTSPEIQKNIDAVKKGFKTIETGPHYNDDLAIVSVEPHNGSYTPKPGDTYSILVKVSSNADPNKTIYFWFEQYDANFSKVSIPPIQGRFRSNYHTVNWPYVKGQSTAQVPLDFPFDSAHTRNGKFYVHIVLSDMRSGSSGNWTQTSDPDFTNNDAEFHAP
jgi:hypothetical protein